jgi:hypothetical protein
MVAAILEKFIYVISVSALYAQGHVHESQLSLAGPDLALGILFIAAFIETSAAL